MMKINYTENAPNSMTFGSIAIGDVFYFKNNLCNRRYKPTIYIKFQNSPNCNHALNLSDFTQYPCRDDEPVVLVEAELNIKY